MSLAEIAKLFSKPKRAKLTKAPFRATRGETKATRLAQEVQVLRITTLIDGKRLHDLAIRTADLSQCVEKGVEQYKYIVILN